MIRQRMFVLAMAASALCSAPACAETQDFGKLTCEQLAALGPDQVAAVLTWIDGYQQGAHQQKFMDYDAIVRVGKSLSKECVKNPQALVLETYGSFRGDE